MDSEHGVILLVEDREDDVLLVRRAFQKAGLLNPLHVIRSGEEAIAYLSGQDPYGNRAEHPLPELILMDLKLPTIDRFELLQWIRSQPGIRGTAVVVLTSSDHIRDVNKAYLLGANSFFVKPTEFQNYVELSRLVRQYWMKHVKVPETLRAPPVPRDSSAPS